MNINWLDFLALLLKEWQVGYNHLPQGAWLFHSFRCNLYAWIAS